MTQPPLMAQPQKPPESKTGRNLFILLGCGCFGVLVVLVGLGALYYFTRKSDTTTTVSTSTSTGTPSTETTSDGPRLADPVGKFSYVLPPNWAPKDFAGAKYKVSADAGREGFAANFYVVDEAFSGSQAEYLRLNEAGVLKMLPKCVVISKGDFNTNTGLTGKILTVENEQYEKQLRQVFYIFPNGKGTMFIVTASCLAKDAAMYKPIFDNAMKTFRFDK